MRIGVDIGGTFTDFVVYDELAGTTRTFKLPSTPDQPEKAVLEGIRTLALAEPVQIIHGSTVATNAVLERKGAKTAFIATEGFKDLLHIGRQNRSELYNLAASRPEPLVPIDLSFELRERVDRSGNVLIHLDEAEIPEIAERLRNEEVESIAVCFLFSFLHPEHERRVSDALVKAGFSVSISSEVLPEFREYERASTTALNAYVMPVMDRYLERLESELTPNPLSVMNSNGGTLSAEQARSQPAKAILSGPAAGVVGALSVAQMVGLDQVISFDMGGTSTDVALSTGDSKLTSEGEIAGLPLSVQMVDIHTVGSGGGSIAYLDAGGQLRVGPESAGAEPGPVCYGRGGERPTVTDANLVAGRLDPDHFLSGTMRLDTKAPIQALEPICSSLNLEVSEAAMGIIQIVNSQMANAIRLVSVARGFDPREFTLVSFGGAGGLHACDVAREVGIQSVVIPNGASTLSAFGMLVADVSKDYVQTVMLPGDTPPAEIDAIFEPLEGEGGRSLSEQGIAEDKTVLLRELDLRYVGQSYELRLPYKKGFLTAFHSKHEQTYGYSDFEREVEIVNIRLRAVGRTARPDLQPAAEEPNVPEPEPIHSEAGQPSFYNGEVLKPRQSIRGASVILYPDTTVYLGPGDLGWVDEYQNLHVRIEAT